MTPANRDLASQVRGPLILITIGVLFLLDRFTPFGFTETWPVILIVVGVVALAGGSRKRRGADYPPSGPPPNVPPGAWR